jgi:diguanylate cyclase (GGDEF)-like protein
MPRKQIDFKAIFAPSDTIAFIVIFMGLFILLFLDDLAVRLIGACIAILGGVALFMMISPRIAGLSLQNRPVSDRTDFTTTKQTSLEGTRITFDNYTEQFGTTEEGDEPFVDTDQLPIFDQDAPASTARPPVTQFAPPPPPKRQEPDIPPVEFDEGESGVRVVGVKGAVRPLTGQPTRAEQRAAARKSEPQSTTSEPFVSGLSDESELELSEDVVIRRKKDDTKATPPAPVAAAPIDEPVVPVAPVVEHTPEIISEPTAEIVAEPIPESLPENSSVPLPGGEHAQATKRRTVDAAISDFTEEPDAIGSNDPRKEFDALLTRVLHVIRSMVSARSAAFFWVNHDREQLVVETHITDIPTAFVEDRKIPMGDDVVSQIARHGRPEILTEIRPSAELTLLPYYQYAARTMSFIGVPVYYGGNVVGVLCADSTDVDAYDSITVGFFGHFTKLIGGLVRAYTEKFDLQQSERMLAALNKYRASLSGSNASLSDVVSSLMDTAVGLMDIHTIGVCTYSARDGQWVVADARSMDPAYKVNGQVVDLDRTAVGHCILNGSTVITTGEPHYRRVTPKETAMIGGQFVAVPLKSTSHNYGALYVENPTVPLSAQDVSTLETLGDYAGLLLELVRQGEMLQTNTMTNMSSGALNRNGLLTRVDQELARAADRKEAFTLCSLQVDPYPTITSQGAAAVERTVLHVLDLLEQQVREYDVVAHLDDGTIMLGLVDHRAQDAQLWAERARKEIASSIVDLDGKRYSVTVSIGVAEAHAKDTSESLIKNAQTAMKQAAKQTNRVTVYA